MSENPRASNLIVGFPNWKSQQDVFLICWLRLNSAAGMAASSLHTGSKMFPHQVTDALNILVVATSWSWLAVGSFSQSFKQWEERLYLSRWDSGLQQARHSLMFVSWRSWHKKLTKRHFMLSYGKCFGYCFDFKQMTDHCEDSTGISKFNNPT